MLLNVLLCATALTAGAGQQPAGEAEVLKREQQRVDYLVSGKFDELAAMLSPTLTYTHSSAVIDDKTAFMEKLRTGQAAYKAMKHSDVKVRFVTPDVAILNGLSDVEVVVAGKPQSIPLRFTIVYVRKSGVWLMEAWQSTRRA